MSQGDEEWRPGEGWPYEVSNLGRVRNAETKHVLSPGPKGPRDTHLADRRSVSLCADGERVSKSVHVLVAEAFLGPRPAGHHVDHINGDPSDNRLDNLRYLPAHLNAAQGKETLTPEEVLEVRRLYEETDLTQRELAERYGIVQQQVSKIVTGKRWTYLMEGGEGSDAIWWSDLGSVEDRVDAIEGYMRRADRPVTDKMARWMIKAIRRLSTDAAPTESRGDEQDEIQVTENGDGTYRLTVNLLDDGMLAALDGENNYLDRDAAEHDAEILRCRLRTTRTEEDDMEIVAWDIEMACGHLFLLRKEDGPPESVHCGCQSEGAGERVSTVPLGALDEEGGDG